MTLLGACEVIPYGGQDSCRLRLHSKLIVFFFYRTRGGNIENFIARYAEYDIVKHSGFLWKFYIFSPNRKKKVKTLILSQKWSFTTYDVMFRNQSITWSQRTLFKCGKGANAPHLRTDADKNLTYSIFKKKANSCGSHSMVFFSCRKRQLHTFTSIYYD